MVMMTEVWDMKEKWIKNEKGADRKKIKNKEKW